MQNTGQSEKLTLFDLNQIKFGLGQMNIMNVPICVHDIKLQNGRVFSIKDYLCNVYRVANLIAV